MNLETLAEKYAYSIGTESASFTLPQLRELIKEFMEQPCKKCHGIGSWTEELFDGIVCCSRREGTGINLEEL